MAVYKRFQKLVIT